MASLSTRRAFAPKALATGLVTIPSSAADLTTTDTVIFQITLANKTAGAITVTVLDKQSPPKTLLGAVSIAANTTLVLNFGEGVLMKKGVNWVASGALSIDADVFGSQI